MPKGEGESVADRLSAVPLFASLSPRDLRTVASTGSVRSFAAGDTIVGKGDKGLGFYLILDGKVEVRAEGKTLATLGPNSFFGEMALFEEQPRTADVVATAPSRCLVLSRWEFWSELAHDPEVLRTLMAAVVGRLRATSKALSE